MLAPRSAKALQEKVLLILHGIRKLPGSPSFGGTLFWIIAELSSLKKADKIYSILCLLLMSSLRNFSELGIPAKMSTRDFDNIAFGKVMTMAVSDHFLIRKLGKNSANESSSKFIPRFYSSFVVVRPAMFLLLQVRSGSGKGSTSSELEARVCIQRRNCLDARSLWKSLKARFGGIEASKKDAKESVEATIYANLKFLRSLPSVWHVVATMIRGQPGLDELDFDDLYNNLKVLLNQQKYSTKDYTQAALKQGVTDPNYTCYKLMKDAMEDIDIRWQVAMITARYGKFIRKIGAWSLMKNVVALWTRWTWLILTGEHKDDDTQCLLLNATKLIGIDELAIRNKVINQEKTQLSQPEIDRNKVIIEDWVDSDDEETDFSEVQKKTVFNSENSETSFENRSPNSQNSVGQGSRTKGLGNKGGKLCFVCYSPNHLIKNCNLHDRTFKQTQTHKPKGTQGSRDTRPVWNNIKRVNHSNFSRNSRYPHQRRSFIPSAVLTREGLKSTARPKMTQTVPSKSTANVFYQGTARSRVPQAVLSRSTGRPYYPRMDNRRPRISSYSPSSRSSTTRTPNRPHRPKKIVKSIWVKKGSTVGSQAVLPQNVSIKRSAMITSKQTGRQKGDYLDSVNRDNGSYTLKQFEYGNPEEDLKDYAIIDSGCSGSMTGDKDKLSDFKDYKG
ncbi:hypothetical protein Tco_1568020 [Tanacetum coccineum]